MNKRMAWAWLAGVCLAWPGCAEKKVDKFQPLEDVPYEIVDWNYGQAKGRKVISANYEIHTTVGDERLLRALPQVMESAFLHYQRLAPFSTPPAERLAVYLFASRPEFDHFTRRFAGRQSDVLVQIRSGGYSMEGITVAQYVSHAITFPIMTHEGFHQYLHVCVNRRVPAWLNEGLAVLCEGQRWDEKGLRQFDPWFNPLRRNRLAEAVRRRQTFPLRELLRINAGHVIDKPGVWVDAYYGQVWALLLFLQEGEGGRYAAGFRRLLESLSRPDLEDFARAAHVTSDSQDYNYGEALFCAFITTDIDAFAAEYERFIEQTIIMGRR